MRKWESRLESADSHVSEKSTYDVEQDKEKSRRASVTSHVSVNSEEHVKDAASAASVTSLIYDHEVGQDKENSYKPYQFKIRIACT